MKAKNVFYICLITLSLINQANADLSDGLVAYFPFNGNANDESGNNHHAIVKGAILTTDNKGNSNSAYLFDGKDDYLEILDADSLDMGFNDYSIAAWIKTTSPSNNGRIFSKGSSACITGYMLRLEGNQAHLENAHNQSCKIIFAGDTDVADDSWHFVVGIVKRTQGALIYIDGRLDASQSLDTSSFDFSNDRNAWIGRNDVHGSEAFNGLIDELRIYSRALSELEIQQLYLLQTNSSTVIAQITNSDAEVIIASPINVQVSEQNSNQTNAFALVTPEATQTSIVLENTILKVEPDTVLLVHPTDILSTSSAPPPVTSLIKGKVQPKVECSQQKDFVLHAILADIIANCDNQRAVTETAEFSTTYSQNGLDGQLTISVITGSVTVTDRNNQSIVLSAGTEQSETSLISKVLRTTWVLPINNDRVYGGQENLLVWTAYENAAGYILEYNLPQPVFSESNSSDIEFSQQTIRLSPDDYEIYEGLVLFRIFIGNHPDKPIVEGRVFAIDDDGKIISESVSSDKVSVSWE